MNSSNWRNGNAGATFVEGDSFLRDSVARVLLDQHFRTLQNLGVRALKGTVTVFGTVGSFYEKQIAISRCRQVKGVRRLIDQIDVDSRFEDETARPAPRSIVKLPR